MGHNLAAHTARWQGAQRRFEEGLRCKFAFIDILHVKTGALFLLMQLRGASQMSCEIVDVIQDSTKANHLLKQGSLFWQIRRENENRLSGTEYHRIGIDRLIFGIKEDVLQS
jgi:hypothetical protein